jgi:CopG family nickel-responsive transcriptional regulator
MPARSQIVSISLEDDLLTRFDGWVKAKGFRSRSSGLAHLMREELDARELADDAAHAVATVTFVYDHHRRELMERLAHLQHEHLDTVVATTHVHLDHDRCLEVLILRGPARDVRQLGNRLIATRGVERGDVFLTSVDHGHGHAHDHAHEGPTWHADAHEPPAKKKVKASRRTLAKRRRT